MQTTVKTSDAYIKIDGSHSFGLNKGVSKIILVVNGGSMPWYDLLRHNFADFLVFVLRLTDSHYGPPVWKNGIIVYSNSLGVFWGAYSNTLGSQIPVTNLL